MSRWAPDRLDLHSSPNESEKEPSIQGGSFAFEGPGGSISGTPTPRRIPIWIRVSPFFLSAFLFLSAVFAVFAPLPILFLNLKNGRRWGWLAILTNSAVVGFGAGKVSFAFFLIFVVTIAGGLPWLLRKRVPRKVPEPVSLATVAGKMLLLMLVVLLGVVAAYGWLEHVHPWIALKGQITQWIDEMGRASVQSGKSLLDGADIDEFKSGVLVELPAAIAVFAMVMVWINLTTLLRLNPSGIRDRLGVEPFFFRHWKAPHFLVWPTIASGFLLIISAGVASDVALNVFKFLMAVYAIQGLSILSFVFDAWNIRGLFRSLGFVVSVLLMMPLLLSLGFFDLWFDFRGKFRQS